MVKAVNNSVKNIDVDDTEFCGYMGLVYTVFGTELIHELFYKEEEK